MARRSGRSEKMAQRAAGPAANPAPPGQLGGQYRPLSDTDLAAIYDSALRLLAELGMGEVPGRLADVLIGAGAVDLGNDRIGLPDTLVKETIAKAAKSFTFHGRDPGRSFEVGGQSVHFGTPLTKPVTTPSRGPHPPIRVSTQGRCGSCERFSCQLRLHTHRVLPSFERERRDRAARICG